MTVAYSCRISFLLVGRRVFSERVNNIQDSDFFMVSGISILIFFSLVGGYSLFRQLVSSPLRIFFPI